MRSILRQWRTISGEHGFRAPFAVLCLCLLIMPVSGLRAESVSELELRAVYLYNFSVFVSWPDSAFETADSPFRYCVVGNPELARTLRKVIDGESVQGRPLRLESAAEPADWRRCHLLYLDASAPDRHQRMLPVLRGLAVLTVGGSPEFITKGGMVTLSRRGRRVKPTIHRDRADAAGIRISSKLLRLSTLVSGEGP